VLDPSQAAGISSVTELQGWGVRLRTAPPRAIEPERDLGPVRGHGIDAASYRATLGPAAERIRRTRSPEEARDLAESLLGDSVRIVGPDVIEMFREEVAYLWSTFPPRLKDLGKYQKMLTVLLGQVIDATWYGSYPRYQSDADVRRDDTLVTFTRSKEDFIVRFDYVQYHDHLLMRIPNWLRLRYRDVRNHPGRYTQGLTTTRCTRAMAALLNQIAETVTYDLRQRQPVRIMVNSVLRTVAFQHSLATWGYVAPRRSAHLAGYAADIEKSWYERHAPRVCGSLEQIVSDLVERDVIHAVDERTHWHICLDPAHIPYLESQFSRWAL
jgi:Family of unknown function (DUF5715)